MAIVVLRTVNCVIDWNHKQCFKRGVLYAISSINRLDFLTL